MIRFRNPDLGRQGGMGGWLDLRTCGYVIFRACQVGFLGGYGGFLQSIRSNWGLDWVGVA